MLPIQKKNPTAVRELLPRTSTKSAQMFPAVVRCTSHQYKVVDVLKQAAAEERGVKTQYEPTVGHLGSAINVEDPSTGRTRPPYRKHSTTQQFTLLYTGPAEGGGLAASNYIHHIYRIEQNGCSRSPPVSNDASTPNFPRLRTPHPVSI